MPLEGDPSWFDTTIIAVGMVSLYAYWLAVHNFVAINAQALLVSGLTLTIIVLMDRLTNAKRKLLAAGKQKICL